jgi:hypothetical protein
LDGLNKTPPSNRPLMQVVVTIILLLACLFMVLSKSYDPNSVHWAYATLGTLVGFWLRGSK